jgi:hypothetical protein
VPGTLTEFLHSSPIQQHPGGSPPGCGAWRPLGVRPSNHKTPLQNIPVPALNIDKHRSVDKNPLLGNPVPNTFAVISFQKL